MKLHEIPGDPTLKKGPRRRGRGHGSGLGKTAGKGHKGIQARSGGHKINRGFEGGQMPLQRRLPKRGFSNKAFANPHQIVNVAQLNAFGDGASVDSAALHAKGLVRRPLPIKVLGDGDLKVKSLTVEADAFSASARRAIEAAGGRCVIAEAKPKPAGE